MSVTVIGEAFIDLIAPAHNINPGETYHRKIAMFVGGLSNVAIEISKLGEEAKFVGKVGNDLFGKYLKQSLKENAVKDLTIRDSAASTGLCISLIYENGERTMIASRGANDNLGVEDIESYIGEIRKSKIIYFSGYSLFNEGVKNGILSCVNQCYKEGIEIFFNPGAPNLIRREFTQIIKEFVDVLILNQQEARILTHKDVNLESLADFAKLAAVTRGNNGCTIIENGKALEVKTDKIMTKNTTGAGDAFAAGFIVGRLRKLSSLDCAKLGNETAKMFLEEKGAL